jgi:CHAD domain-containing protein
MAPLNKWIESLSPDGRVSDAARVSLEARLAAVSYWLPLAARPVDDDVEKVHQLRVATRRAIAALDLYDDWLPEQPATWLTRRLKKIRRAAGEARDLDVLVAWIGKQIGDSGRELCARIEVARAAAQPDVVAIAEKCEQANRFHRKTYRLLAGTKARGRKAKKQDVSFRNWAESRLGHVAEKFFDALPSHSTDLSALHQFRIRGKQLRYALELLASAFGPELRQVHYPIVEKLQELLGRVNDCVVGDQRLRDWRRKTESHAERELLDQLIARRRSQLDESIVDYRNWWTPERSTVLREGLFTLTAQAAPPTAVEEASVETPPTDAPAASTVEEF